MTTFVSCNAWPAKDTSTESGAATTAAARNSSDGTLKFSARHGQQPVQQSRTHPISSGNAHGGSAEALHSSSRQSAPIDRTMATEASTG